MAIVSLARIKTIQSICLKEIFKINLSSLKNVLSWYQFYQ